MQSIDRLDRWRRRADQLAARSRRLGNLRMLTVLVTFVLAFAASRTLGAAFVWTTVALGAGVFALLVARHDRLERARQRTALWCELEGRHQARRRRDWSGLEDPRADDVDPSHPFAHDLDLVGEHSLLRLIDTTVSRGGHRRLRAWLEDPRPDAAAIRRRQGRVAALVPARHLRRRLALAARIGLGARKDHWDTDRLGAIIGRGRDEGSLRRRTWVLCALALVTAALVVVKIQAGGPPWWIASFLTYLALTTASLRRLAPLFDDALELEALLEPLGHVLGWLETRPVPPELDDVVAPLRARDAHRPSAMLERVRRIAWGAGLRTTQILWVLVNAVVPWDMIFAWRLEGARRELSAHLPAWLDALHELEATSALAELADVTPGSSFPTLVDDGPLLEARGLAHPLLPTSQSVANDFTIDRDGRVFLITGSNMAGKSTFLRTVGLNVVLAQAGGPVVAQDMSWRGLRVFTCIQVADSVKDGISYFYAEVRRLAQLLAAAEADDPWPPLSIVDEIYRGTNNRERRAGSEAFIQHLHGRRGVLLLSTHDLDLATLANTHEEIRNLHFREEVHDGRMEFDFLLREGVSPTTNALRVMEREGLPVPPATEEMR